MMRLWHDDIRPNPPGWVWARTNEQAKAFLRGGQVIEISMDHDLGFHDVEIPDDPDDLMDLIYMKGQSEETGLDLVRWMVEHQLVPERIRIHSWNPDKAIEMARTFNDYGHDCEVRAFDPTKELAA